MVYNSGTESRGNTFVGRWRGRGRHSIGIDTGRNVLTVLVPLLTNGISTRSSGQEQKWAAREISK